VKAAQTRLAMLAGEKFSFQDEAEGLFGVRPPIKPLSAYDPILARSTSWSPARATWRPASPPSRPATPSRPTGWSR
jgi:hypothetical protein